MEHRVATELRTERRRLVGYAATFGAEARIADFVETIAPGAFADSLRSGGDVLALVDHDPSALLARTKTGTLRLHEDDRGLAFEIALPDTTLGRDVLAMAERGDLGGMSFGFLVKDEQWQGRRRELRALDLLEVSVVHAWPAYDGTAVDARNRTPRLNRARRLIEVMKWTG